MMRELPYRTNNILLLLFFYFISPHYLRPGCLLFFVLFFQSSQSVVGGCVAHADVFKSQPQRVRIDGKTMKKQKDESSIDENSNALLLTGK
jgi:hypothetical protein